MLLSPEALVAFVPAALLVIVVPGPATLLVLGELRLSRGCAAAAVAGLVVGDLLLIAAAGLGLAALLVQWPLLLTALRWAGAAYIGWMGASALLRRPTTSVEPARARAGGGFRSALLLTLVNPKPVLFFSAFFPLFLSGGSAPWLNGFMTLGALFELLNILWFALVIGAAGTLGRRLRPGPWLERCGGAALLGCALLVLLG